LTLPQLNNGVVAFNARHSSHDAGGNRSSGALQQHSRHHLDLQVLYDGRPQKLEIVGIDAVPVNSQDGEQPGDLIRVTRSGCQRIACRIPVKGAFSCVKVAQLVTNNITPVRWRL